MLALVFVARVGGQPGGVCFRGRRGGGSDGNRECDRSQSLGNPKDLLSWGNDREHSAVAVRSLPTELRPRRQR
jgi:hypothetical protein